jgi:hypothetical protein
MSSHIGRNAPSFMVDEAEFNWLEGDSQKLMSRFVFEHPDLRGRPFAKGEC